MRHAWKGTLGTAWIIKYIRLIGCAVHTGKAVFGEPDLFRLRNPCRNTAIRVGVYVFPKPLNVFPCIGRTKCCGSGTRFIGIIKIIPFTRKPTGTHRIHIITKRRLWCIGQGEIGINADHINIRRSPQRIHVIPSAIGMMVLRPIRCIGKLNTCAKNAPHRCCE